MNSPISGPSGWQLIFTSFAVVIILLEMVRGWRLGLMRQLVRLVALLVAYACAIAGGRVVLPFARHLLKMPDALLAIVAGAVLAFLAYTVITTIGVVLFKRTGQHGNKAARLVWGGSGAIIGIFFGAFFVWLVFAGVRLIGSVAAVQVHSRSALNSATLQPVWNRPLQIKGRARAAEPRPSALSSTLAQMKNSVEAGGIGALLQNIDPTPPGTYRTVEKLGAVVTNLDRAERFLNFPGAHQIRDNPKVVALRNDPEIADLITHGRLLELVQHQRVIDAMNDPALRDEVGHFDLERALDYALEKNSRANETAN